MIGQLLERAVGVQKSVPHVAFFSCKRFIVELSDHRAKRRQASSCSHEQNAGKASGSLFQSKVARNAIEIGQTAISVGLVAKERFGKPPRVLVLTFLQHNVEFKPSMLKRFRGRRSNGIGVSDGPVAGHSVFVEVRGVADVAVRDP